MQQNPPDLKTLRRLRPLAQFTDEQLQSLCHQLNIQTAHNRERLIQLGCTEEYSLFVLKGDIKTIARDSAVKQLSFGESDELNPVAQLRPSMYDVYAAGPIQYLKIENKRLSEFANLSESGDEDISVTNPLTINLYQDLMLDKISLPSLPDVALRIQQVFKDENVDAGKVASILMTDPAITSKLIKVANSPVYQGVAATETLPAAIVRLGMDTTYKQVMAYAVNELFKGRSASVLKCMETLWAHSRKVAAISRLLAVSTGLFNPEQAMLAGLTHDLGVIVIVEYFQQQDEDPSDNENLQETIRLMRPQITGLLMHKWNFSNDMVMVAEECEDWFRNPSDSADLCDLVMVAQYHSLMGTRDIKSMPPIAKIPAMAKLKMGPQESIDLIKQSNREINEIERMLQ